MARGRRRYFCFLVFNVFLLTTFSGSLFEELGTATLGNSNPRVFIRLSLSFCLLWCSTNTHLVMRACAGAVLDSPKTLPEILARTLPSQSNFFLSYILINGLYSWTMVLGQFGPVFKLIMCKKAYRPDRTKRRGPGIVDYISVAPKVLLVFLLAINFAMIAPLILLPAAASCATVHAVHKFLFLYVRLSVLPPCRHKRAEQCLNAHEHTLCPHPTLRFSLWCVVRSVWCMVCGVCSLSKRWRLAGSHANGRRRWKGMALVCPVYYLIARICALRSLRGFQLEGWLYAGLINDPAADLHESPIFGHWQH